ncbi:MAG TPA: response regulator transcription factor [Bryobacteraceae bacterium]|jgi:two-component system response regulator NreC|nr:response regulator transcription factor [Bryobacteraceae bacterium]
MSKVRIVLADDHTLFRHGMMTLIASEDDMEVVGEAASGTEAVMVVQQANPSILLLDIGMAGVSSFEAMRHIRKQNPDTKIILLTMYDDEDYLVEGMKMGARGYVLKDSPSAQLIHAVREVSNGGTYVSPRMLSHLVEGFRAQFLSGDRQSRLTALTPREREVVKFLAEGKSVRQIAGALGLSIKTIEAHKFNLMRKLNIHNKAHLVQYAIQKKIIQLPAPA